MPNNHTLDFIETDNLRLRKFDEHTLKAIFEMYDTHELMRFFGCDIEGVQEERRRFNGSYTTFNKKILFFHLIEKNSNQVIGWCGYHTWYIDHQRAELGYTIFNEADRKKGYMKEAVGPILNYGFTSMNLHRIEALIGKNNPPSRNILDHFGFTYEGTLREHCKTAKGIEDSLIFSLLKKEFILKK